MKYAVAVGLVLLVLPLTRSLKSQVLVLESESADETLAACQMKHIVGDCSYIHVDTAGPYSLGGVLKLDGKSYILDWMGPGYYLDSGVTLQPIGTLTTDLREQSWLEVYPERGRIHTSRGWQDRDGNQALSAFDMLELDADPASMVLDVRLQLRVRPAAQEP
jgi:hypothetical protein